jgi:Uncharacterized protein containing LysM domain
MIDPSTEDLELRTNNPYSIGNIFSFSEGDFALEREPIVIERSIRDRYHTVVEGDTLSTIAFDKYNDSKEWWVIADVNNLDWTFQLEVGTVLLIPDLNRVKITL